LTEADRENAEASLHDAFSRLDAHLADHPWLAGNEFSLADITWAPLHFTLERAGYAFDRYRNVTRWALAIAERPSFDAAVLQWFEGPPPDFS
jgi:glutathione S-transferase